VQESTRAQGENEERGFMESCGLGSASLSVKSAGGVHVWF
jgi:hypothetical protein